MPFQRLTRKVYLFWNTSTGVCFRQIIQCHIERNEVKSKYLNRLKIKVYFIGVIWRKLKTKRELLQY